MSFRAALAYGSRPLEVDLPAHSQLIEPPRGPKAPELAEILERALDSPVGAERLERAVKPGQRVLVIVSDATRDDPRGPMLEAIRRRLPQGAAMAVAVANGTHAPGPLDELGLPSWVSGAINHDGHRSSELIELGRTRRGTPLRVHRAVAAADWVIATGCIRPHYFAGYGAGAKSIFPGLGENDAIRVNHRLKLEPMARAGVVEGNPCREDLEEVLDRLPGQAFLLNVVVDARGVAQTAVSGDVRLAFREGARRCEPLFRVRAPKSSCIVVSDHLPVAGSLYQASKLVAAVAPLLCDGGKVVLAVEAPDGTGPVDVVNSAIYEIGVRPRLPANHQILLVSGLSSEAVAGTYCEWSSSVAEAVGGEAALVFPEGAAYLLIEPT